MARKEKKTKSEFWRKLKFKYRISAINENTLEEMWRVRTSLFWGLVALVVFAFVLIISTSAIIITTPIRNYLPGYLDSEVREMSLRSAVEIDALERKVNAQDVYISNLKDVFSGKVTVDSVKLMDSIKVSMDDPMLSKTTREKAFVDNYASEEMYNLSVLVNEKTTPATSTSFYKPVSGAIVSPFNIAESNFGVKIAISKKETVLATLEGVVVYSGYGVTDGYMIHVQHVNGFVSIYKHNTMLLAKTGDKVKTGAAIAIVDLPKLTKEEQAEKVDNTCLVEFELWYNGKPIDPQNYIYFN